MAIAATAWEQSAFRAGPLTASLPAVTVSEPIVGSVLGIAVLGETLNTNTVGWVAVSVSVAVMAVATVALAHSQATATPGERREAVANIADHRICSRQLLRREQFASARDWLNRFSADVSARPANLAK